jgi:hypothetical protein
MNKTFIIAWVVLFVASFLGGFLVHGVLLHSDYMQVANLFRPESEQTHYFGWMLLAHVIMAGAFVWIYARGVETKPWLAQGVRYGVVVALLAVVPIYMIYYAVQPMPGSIVVKQIIFGTLWMIVLGIVVAWLYRGTARRRQCQERSSRGCQK